MQKIPVLATAVSAYRFSVDNYFRLLGVFWAPILLTMLIVVGYFFPLITRMQAAMVSRDPAAILRNSGQLLTSEFVALLLLIVMCVGVTRLALGLKVKWPFFYFAVGGDFWRLLGAVLLVGLILFAALIVVLIASTTGLVLLEAAISGAHSDPIFIRRGFQLLLILALYSLMAFVWVRLAFLLPPIVIAEKRLGLGRNWTLTRGNSWRVLGIFLLILLPTLVLGIVQYVFMAVFGGYSLNITDYFDSPQEQMAVSQYIMRLYASYWFLYVAAWLLLAPLLYGALMASSALCYRTLVPPAAV